MDTKRSGSLLIVTTWLIPALISLILLSLLGVSPARPHYTLANGVFAVCFLLIPSWFMVCLITSICKKSYVALGGVLFCLLDGFLWLVTCLKLYPPCPH